MLLKKCTLEELVAPVVRNKTSNVITHFHRDGVGLSKCHCLSASYRSAAAPFYLCVVVQPLHTELIHRVCAPPALSRPHLPILPSAAWSLVWWYWSAAIVSPQMCDCCSTMTISSGKVQRSKSPPPSIWYPLMVLIFWYLFDCRKTSKSVYISW